MSTNCCFLVPIQILSVVSLFEVQEVYDGVVASASIAREAGVRSRLLFLPLTSALTLVLVLVLRAAVPAP